MDGEGHETITRQALRLAALDGDGAEYVRGALFNDNPTEHPLDEASMRVFALAIEAAANGRVFGPEDPLPLRSHLGDLQFLHAMAARDGEEAAATLEGVLRWAAFAYGVAAGEIGPATPLGEVPVPGFAALFPEQRDDTVAALFNVRDGDGDVRQRAAGSLLHVIQDSHSPGHTQREDLGGGRWGRVVSFHAYVHQDPGLHGRDDRTPEGDTPRERLARLPGGEAAVERSAELLRLLQAGTPWSEVERHLRTEVFALVPDPPAAGPGDAYRRQ